MTRNYFLSALMTGTLLFSGAAFGGHGSGIHRDAATTDVDSSESADLKYMREEEKLARDVYLTMDEYWGHETQVFANIAESEQQHTNTVDYLLDKYDVADPVVNDVVGVFVNQDLQALYNQLVQTGANSLIEALQVGALIEETDMRDIVAAINETDERAIILAYSNLLDGSKNHLRAFVSVIESQGLVYEAQLLDPEEVSLILNE